MIDRETKNKRNTDTPYGRAATLAFAAAQLRDVNNAPLTPTDEAILQGRPLTIQQIEEASCTYDC